MGLLALVVLVRSFGFGVEQIFLEIGFFGNFPFLGFLGLGFCSLSYGCILMIVV